MTQHSPDAKKLSPDSAVLMIDSGPLRGQNIVETALSIVFAYPPQGYNTKTFYQWTRNKPEGRKVFILQVMNNGEFWPCFPTNVSYATSSDHTMDAGTLVLGNNKTGEFSTRTLINFEKVCFNAFGREYPDTLARLTVVLAHELYGNALWYQEQSSDVLQSLAAKGQRGRMEQEVAVYTESVNFCQRILNSDLSFPKKFMNDIHQAKQREEHALLGWQRGLKKLNATSSKENSPKVA